MRPRHVKGAVAVVERVRVDLGDALDRAGDVVAHGMALIQQLHQLEVDRVIRHVVVHADLLRDDAPLLFHGLGREVGRRDKAQQRAQVLLKVLRAAEIIHRLIIGGEGIGIRAHDGHALQDVDAVGHVEHLVLEIVRHARGGVAPLSREQKAAHQSAVIGAEAGKAGRKALLRDHAHAQAVRQHRALERFADAVIAFRQDLHRFPPQRRGALPRSGRSPHPPLPRLLPRSRRR